MLFYYVFIIVSFVNVCMYKNISWTSNLSTNKLKIQFNSNLYIALNNVHYQKVVLSSVYKLYIFILALMIKPEATVAGKISLRL